MGNEKSYNDGIAYRPVGNHTPDDSTEISVEHIGIEAVDASGEVVLTNHQDADTTMYCTQGIIYAINCKKIKETGTTATNFALFS